MMVNSWNRIGLRGKVRLADACRRAGALKPESLGRLAQTVSDFRRSGAELEYFHF